MKDKKTEYMCSYCGRKVVRRDFAGRPEPGKCPRKPVINRIRGESTGDLKHN